MADEPDLTKPWCFWVDETMHTPNGFVPALVVEGESGYWPMMGNGKGSSPWYWGDTIEKAREVCAKANADRGIDPKRADEIVLSSMAATNREQARREEVQERWREIKEGRA